MLVGKEALLLFEARPIDSSDPLTQPLNKQLWEVRNNPAGSSMNPIPA